MSAASPSRRGDRDRRGRWATVVTAYPAAILRALSRDRAALFIAFLLPAAIIVVVGVAFGGTTKLDVGWVDLDDGAVSEQVVESLSLNPALNASAFPDEAALQTALNRKEILAGLVIPADTTARASIGESAPIRVVAQTNDSQGVAAALALRAAVAPTNASVGAALAVQAAGGGPFAESYSTAREATGTSGAVEVVTVGGADGVPLSRFSQTAAQNLVLFVFMTAMISASFVVTARRHGVLRRSLSTSASPAQVLVGLCLAILAVTFVQSTVIVLIGSVVFRVDWGPPVVAAVLILITNLAAAALGVLLGAVGRNPDRTAAMAPILAIALAVVGGCIIPLELFPDSLRTVAHVVPQYWAVSGWQSLIFDGAGLSAITMNLSVLLAFAAGSLAIALGVFGRQLRRSSV
jgi:ABC-2 type transport system permease protein